jgi:hypothetical protein
MSVRSVFDDTQFSPFYGLPPAPSRAGQAGVAQWAAALTLIGNVTLLFPGTKRNAIED